MSNNPTDGGADVNEVNEFLTWLGEQDYWVNRRVVDEKFPAIEFHRMIGITTRYNEDGDTLIPKRDLRHLVRRE